MLRTVADETVEFTPEAVMAYLDDAITRWREQMMKTNIASALCYTDAFQSVRVSLFGEQLPTTPELDEWMAKTDTDRVVINLQSFSHGQVLAGRFQEKDG